MEHKESINRSQMWYDRLEDLSSSGLTQKEWCRKNQIPLTTLRYWKRKLRSDAGQPSGMAWVTAGSLKPAAMHDAGLTIRKPGILIQLSGDADPDLCLDLLHVLIRS